MWNGIMARLVARAIPPGITDPDQERVAGEAAENGILSVLRFSVCIVAILLTALAGLFYQDFLRRQVTPEPRQVARASSQVEADAMLHQTDVLSKSEDAQNKLDALIKSQDAVQGKVSDLEKQVADLTSRLRESDKLQPVTDSAESRKGSAASKKTATRVDAENLSAGAGPRGDTKVEKPSAPATYVCGDGRTVRDPGVCKTVSARGAQANLRGIQPGGKD